MITHKDKPELRNALRILVNLPFPEFMHFYRVLRDDGYPGEPEELHELLKSEFYADDLPGGDLPPEESHIVNPDRVNEAMRTAARDRRNRPDSFA